MSKYKARARRMAWQRVSLDRQNHHLKLMGVEKAATQHWDDYKQSLNKHNAAMKQAAKLKSEVPKLGLRSFIACSDKSGAKHQ